MPTLRMVCDVCETIVDRDPEEVLLTSDYTRYIFWCDECGENVSKPTDHAILALLQAAGVVVMERELPVLTVDDLLDFHDAIDHEIGELLRG
jgi:hypothetical protein